MVGIKDNKLVKNIFWTASVQGIRVIVQILTIGVLSRIIPAEEYGAMAACFVVINLAYVFRDGGVANSLIRVDSLDKIFIDTAFFISFSLGFVIFLILQIFHESIGALFGIMGVGELIKIVSWVFVFSGFGAIPQALLERSGNFKKIAQAEIFSSVFAFILALILAINNFGAKALAASFFANVAITSVLYVILAKWRPGISWSATRSREILSFGGGVLGFNSINYIARNADIPIISRALGVVQVGYYSQAYKIMLFPVQNITGAINRGMYPELCSRIRSGHGAHEIYCRILRSLSFCIWPLMIFVAIESESVIFVVLGEKWLLASPVLFWLALTGCIQALVSTTGGALQAMGRISELLKLGTLATLLQLGAFLMGVSSGIEYMAKLYFWANFFNGIFALYFVIKFIGAKINAISLDVGLNLIVSSTVVVVAHLFVDRVLCLDVGALRLIVGFSAVAFFLMVVIYLLHFSSEGGFLEKLMKGVKFMISGGSVTGFWRIV
ncbi:lipopolysaccharide biosynthesis protein [Sphaerotilus sulfidivorans]|uniref:lipopolysaccharide biosynthesis protein n=1 Tax=Sphaerotilus sulfidivorans TaxID=639200 RepID=UPI0015DA85D5|nr:lipopolysaccharide biosynthesis protein [Sphaerotilus sulfidivorans]NZD46328.1 lipopolysaccharide biosynthesis protein [Sphaerotilus sulfidivorans]